MSNLDELVSAFNNGGFKVPEPEPVIESSPLSAIKESSRIFEVGGFNHLTPASAEGNAHVGVEDLSPSTPTILATAEVEHSPQTNRNKETNRSPSNTPDGLLIDSPIDLLLLVDDDILSGRTKLHDWQVKFMMDFARMEHTKDSPFQAAVQACNNSGKDKYIIAVCAVWLCMRYQEADSIITSSSGNQLDKQTAVHISRLCNAVNARIGEFWNCKYRYYECKFTNPDGIVRLSTIKMFATDEPGKAEGFHPVEAGRKMALFTSETKSIPPDITDALERCSGFTHRVDASSPGLPVGYFYNICTGGIPREAVEDIKSLSSTQTIVYKITYYKCSHITEAEMDRLAEKQFANGGRNSPIFRSSALAEFTSTDEMVVIPSDFVWKCVRNKSPIWYKENFNTGGLDFSDGGAETVLVIRNGNKMIGMEAFRFQDTQDTINYLVEKFIYWKLNTKGSKIYGDCCGIGKPMMDSLKALKWTNLVYVDSRNSPSEAFTYSNRATELFFNVQKLMAKGELIVPEDKLLITQLCTRFYKLNNDNISALLTKKEMKSKGFASPDRADAFNLAFWRYKSNTPDIEIPSESPVEQIEETEQKPTPIFDLREWANRSQKQFVPDHNTDLSDLQETIRDYNNNLQRMN